MRRLVLVWAISAIAALAPSLAFADDEAIAKHIVERLNSAKQKGELRGFQVDLEVKDGTVWFRGSVATAAQEKLVLETGQMAPGAVKVVDGINVASNEATVTARQTNYQEPTTHSYGAANYQRIAPSAMAQTPVPMSMASHGAAAPPRPQMAGPMAMGGPMHATGATSDQPQLPGYAWPSYAAYPNYGALTYPQQYSPTAWPYIGPFYPYPQVPLGWRKVTLQWDDGWWMLDFHDR
jgi:hypothetical protein